MTAKTLKLSAAATVLAAALVYSALGYFTGTVPFPAQQRGELRADAVCSALGDGDRAATELNKVLPTRGDYSTEETNPPRTTDDTTWQSTCFINGDGDQLLVAGAELARFGSAEDWLDDPSRAHASAPDASGPKKSFEAGEAAVVTNRTAEILVQCVPEGELPGGAHQLSIEVHAKHTLQGTPAETRRALTTLALTTADAAHTRAKCSTPSQLPRKITG